MQTYPRVQSPAADPDLDPRIDLVRDPAYGVGADVKVHRKLAELFEVADMFAAKGNAGAF
jgi:hypothetical protein